MRKPEGWGHSTGALLAASASTPGARRGRSILRTVIGGALALGATYLVGSLFGVAAG